MSDVTKKAANTSSSTVRKSSSVARKNDKSDRKPDYSYLPKVFMDQVSYCMEAGATKYGRNNYQKGHKLLQLTAAASRHIKLIEEGEDIDKDTSERIGVDIHHWACVAANALMALHQLKLGTLDDNRATKPDLLGTYKMGHVAEDDTGMVRYYNELGQQITDVEFNILNNLTTPTDYATIDNSSDNTDVVMRNYLYHD